MANGPLSLEQLEQYRRDGYALVDKAQFEAMRSENAWLKEQIRISDRAVATATVALVEAVLGPVSQPALTACKADVTTSKFTRRA